jgi:hypothetical protein
VPPESSKKHTLYSSATFLGRAFLGTAQDRAMEREMSIESTKLQVILSKNLEIVGSYWKMTC